MTLDEYKALLKRHDWFYEFSDDHREWKRGNEQRKTLEAAQPMIDPDKSIWRSFSNPVLSN